MPKTIAYEPPAFMNSTFWALNDADTSASASLLSSLYNVLFFVLIVRTVPVSTEYACSRIGLSSLFKIGQPLESSFFTQFFKSTPIPPVTPTVVKKIGEIPFVPAIIGEIFTNGIYGLAGFPVHNATLLTPDILEEPTPIVPFSAINMTRLPGFFFWSFWISD